LEEKITKDARESFFSGHTSVSAASCVFAAEVFCAIKPNSRWKPWVRGGSFVLPATVGFLSYRTGKHFPTDVLTGWVIGSFIGWAIPQLHRIDKSSKLGRIEILPNPSGISFVFR